MVPIDWGEDTARELEEPTITSRVNGVATVSEPRLAWSPAGLLSTVRRTVRGSIRRVTVVISPRESVAVIRSSR